MWEKGEGRKDKKENLEINFNTYNTKIIIASNSISFKLLFVPLNSFLTIVLDHFHKSILFLAVHLGHTDDQAFKDRASVGQKLLICGKDVFSKIPIYSLPYCLHPLTSHHWDLLFHSHLYGIYNVLRD